MKRRIALLLGVLLMGTLLAAGCVMNSVNVRITVTGKITTDLSGHSQMLILTDYGSLGVLNTDDYNKLQVNHSYVVELGGLNNAYVGIRSIVKEV